MMHAIPVAASDSPELIAQSLEIAGREIGRGHVVCIFAEGSISRTGNLLKFRRGLERIASGVRCPIVPVYLDGVWGSIFSFDRGRFLFKRPRRILEPVTVFFGRPLPSSAHSDRVRQAIQELSAQAFRSHQPTQRPIHIAFIRRAKKRWRAVLASDGQGATTSFGNALVRAIAISRSLWRGAPVSEERVGILMPPGIDAMLANLAVYIGGRVPVNLDYGQPGDIAPSMVQSAGIREVLSSRGFAKAPALAGRLGDVRLRFVEDAEHSWSGWRRAALYGACRVLPGFLIARFFVRGELRSVDHIATILYSASPAEPDHPRGAMLTHHNLLSNLESLRQVFRVTRDDCILGLLPFSNSLGFSATLLLPMLTGARVVYAAQASSAGFGPICREARVTLIPATPALLSTIMENVAAQELGELRHVAVGGGDLDERLRDSFAAKFGVEPLEGYGCPECAPIISLNVPDYVKGRQRQYGSRRGSAGHPLPGVCVRVADPQSGEPLPQGKQGVLMVRGPNVMKGYIDGAEATSRVLLDGWYVTGELASLDSDGFIHMAARSASPPPAS
jgi:acyl-[acyl-carrier-protein]-phospholipid O-acyltransferase/long-chain-fatty-acid--[acyl-carrier-protein] ligase